MNTRKMLLRTLLLIFAATALLLVLAPQGAAQTNQADARLTLGTVADPPAITPDTGTATIKVPWTYSISTVATNVLGEVTRTTSLQWDPPQCPPGVSLTGSLSETIVLSQEAGAPENSWSGESTFNVQVSLQAPGEQPLTCNLSAKVLAIPGIKESNIAPTQVNVRAAYLGLISVNAPTTIAQAGPQKQIRYDLQISNLGNSESNVVFRLLTENVGSWDPVIPTQVLLASPTKATEGTTQTVSFQISTPYKNGWNNDQKTFQLEITPVSTKNLDDEGQTVVVTVLSRVRGVYIPTVGPMLMVAGLAAVVAVVRRNRIE